ncbi:IS3 family transposase [Labilibaculum sp.]|uniref:IS3 family transposase n=1 Tax=Labilibaculum sp. TaxID=2060723 RepID=UPI002AA94CFD|nr:IS3 family transposase [Labilibaculum sp.]
MKDLLKYVGLSESSYYYKEKLNGRKGVLPSKQTKHSNDGLVEERTVVEAIKGVLEHEFIDCGYRIMTKYLQRKGYKINHKKVYRIMSNTGLLKPNSRIKRSGGGRKFVRFRKVHTSHPMECLEMDIKMIWIPNMGKNAYLLSIIDVHTRKILGYTFAFNVKQKEVIELLSTIVDEYPTPESLIIRSDNGSQFIARNVRDYIHLVGFEQEFTHVATPEENAHIEAYHGTLKRDIFDRVDYRTFGEIQQIIKRYVPFYNSERLHGLLGRITPNEKWKQDQHLIKKLGKIA